MILELMKECERAGPSKACSILKD